MFREDWIQVVLPDVGDGVLVAIKPLRAYMDRGYKSEADGIMCVAAALFKKADYERFCRAWDRFLAGWGASAFHATDFYGGYGEFSRFDDDGVLIPERYELYLKDSKRLPSLIVEHAYHLCGISLKEKEYELEAPLEWRQRFGGPHRVAAQALVGGIGHWAKKARFKGRIIYFYELGDPEENDVKTALDAQFDNPKHRAHCRMAVTPIGVPKDEARGLGVADFIAWHWNKFYVDSIAASPEKRRDPRKDLQALLNGYDVQVALLTGNELDRYLIALGCHRKPGPSLRIGLGAVPR